MVVASRTSTPTVSGNKRKGTSDPDTEHMSRRGEPEARERETSPDTKGAHFCEPFFRRNGCFRRRAFYSPLDRALLEPAIDRSSAGCLGAPDSNSGLDLLPRRQTRRGSEKRTAGGCAEQWAMRHESLEYGRARHGTQATPMARVGGSEHGQAQRVVSDRPIRAPTRRRMVAELDVLLGDVRRRSACIRRPSARARAGDGSASRSSIIT